MGAINEQGNKYGIWIVKGRCLPNYNEERASVARWTCECEYCGNKVVYLGTTLRSGKYSSYCKECGGR